MITWRAVYNDTNFFRLVIFRRSIHRKTNLGSSNVVDIYPHNSREKMSFSSDTSDHFMNQRAPLDIDGLAPDCSNSTVNALESLQTCAKLASAKLSTSWCMGSVWSYCQDGQLLWSIESHMRGQSNHSKHSVPRATIQAQHYSNHIYCETAVLTQKLVL